MNSYDDLLAIVAEGEKRTKLVFTAGVCQHLYCDIDFFLELLLSSFNSDKKRNKKIVQSYQPSDYKIPLVLSAAANLFFAQLSREPSLVYVAFDKVVTVKNSADNQAVLIFDDGTRILVACGVRSARHQLEATKQLSEKMAERRSELINNFLLSYDPQS